MACVRDLRASHEREINSDGLVCELRVRAATSYVGIWWRNFPYEKEGVIIPVEELAFRSEVANVG